MRYYIIIGLTIIVSVIILLYNPYAKYLGVYKDKLTIEYNFDKIDNYTWNYKTDNNNIKIKTLGYSKWKVEPLKNGETTLEIYYSNEKDFTKKYKYKIIYKFKIKNNKIFWTFGEGFGLEWYPNPY